MHPDDRASRFVSFRVTNDVYAYMKELPAQRRRTMSQWLSDLICVEMERAEERYVEPDERKAPTDG